ncbi:MAG: hypothetical protein ACE5I3_02815 [Phycisphaerae bacterium]
MMPGSTPGRIAAGFALALAMCLPTFVHADDHTAQVRRLVDKIARGDEVEAAAAGEQLIELVTAPLADAIGPLDTRPVAEQVRLRQVLARLTGALRMRICRLDLPSEDRELFDAFAAAYPELVPRLFDGNYRVRKAAVHQIPLEPRTGAGVLLAAKVNDEDDDVAGTALDVAARLHDAVVARNLTRYIRDATATVRSGFYGPQEQDLARTVALIVFRSIKIVADAEFAQSTSDLVTALQFFGRSRYWDHYQRSEVMRILGKLADTRAAPALLDFLDDPALLRVRNTQPGKRVSETVGDVALLSLLRIYGLRPEDFGLLVPDATQDFAGYADDEARRAGHRAFRIWHRQHARPPSTQARPPSSQPAREQKK